MADPDLDGNGLPLMINGMPVTRAEWEAAMAQGMNGPFAAHDPKKTRFYQAVEQVVEEVLARLRDTDPRGVQRQHIDQAWTIIANVGQGDWATQSLPWRRAAARWRDQVFGSFTPTVDSLDATSVRINATDAPPPMPDLDPTLLGWTGKGVPPPRSAQPGVKARGDADYVEKAVRDVLTASRYIALVTMADGTPTVAGRNFYRALNNLAAALPDGEW